MHRDVVGDIGHAAGVDDPDSQLLLVLLETGEIGLGADDCKRVAVNLGAIPNVGAQFITPDKPSAADLEQEREAILRMIAEGRISPEEGDMLLEGLGG